MSRFAFAAVGLGLAAGLGYAVWRYRKVRAAQDSDEQAQADSRATPTMSLMQDILDSNPPKVDSTAPPKPEPKPKKPKRRKKHRPAITRSTYSKRTGHVHQSPDSLLSQARVVFPDLTLTEYTAARVVASEHYRGNPTEWAAILDAELNRSPADLAKFTDHIAPIGKYGYQGRGKRRVATTRDPARAHVETARRVLSGELRGISQGAVIFFDPRSQLASHYKWVNGESDRQHCKPAVILRRWSFGHPWSDKANCKLNTAKVRKRREWVGPIDNIDPLRLMLFRPSKGGERHQRQYEAALTLLKKAGLA